MFKVGFVVLLTGIVAIEVIVIAGIIMDRRLGKFFRIALAAAVALLFLAIDLLYCGYG